VDPVVANRLNSSREKMERNLQNYPTSMRMDGYLVFMKRNWSGTVASIKVVGAPNLKYLASH
jgi:hypothetical protein